MRRQGHAGERNAHSCGPAVFGGYLLGELHERTRGFVQEQSSDLIAVRWRCDGGVDLGRLSDVAPRRHDLTV